MRTRLFHSVVVFGSGMLAGCGASHKATSTGGGNDLSNTAADGGVPDAAVVQPYIEDSPPPPRIHAVTPEKMGIPDSP
jgi:hypothetical protein